VTILFILYFCSYYVLHVISENKRQITISTTLHFLRMLPKITCLHEKISLHHDNSRRWCFTFCYRSNFFLSSLVFFRLVQSIVIIRSVHSCFCASIGTPQEVQGIDFGLVWDLQFRSISKCVQCEQPIILWELPFSKWLPFVPNTTLWTMNLQNTLLLQTITNNYFILLATFTASFISKSPYQPF
jgi:hypothetical protein